MGLLATSGFEILDSQTNLKLKGLLLKKTTINGSFSDFKFRNFIFQILKFRNFWFQVPTQNSGFTSKKDHY